MRAVFMLYTLKKMRGREALALLLPDVTPPVNGKIDLDRDDKNTQNKTLSSPPPLPLSSQLSQNRAVLIGGKV